LGDAIQEALDRRGAGGGDGGEKQQTVSGKKKKKVKGVPLFSTSAQTYRR
jgi:hypothetical protein